MPNGRIPVALTSYQHRSLPISAQRVVNWFAEQEPQDARSRMPLLPTPGLTRFATLASGPVRGAALMGSYLYVVSGTGVYRVDVAGASLFLGNIADGGPVSMANNGTQMAIVTPETQQGWVATSTTVTQITDATFLSFGAVYVTSLDGYGIFVKPNSTQFFISNLKDMATYNALNLASAEADPDNLILGSAVGRELWLVGESSIEIWANTGAADFTFQRISGAFIKRGTAARNSFATIGSTPFWLGENRVVYKGNGAGPPQRISTHAIEQAIAGYSVASDARGWTYEQEGHQFYGLTFPTEGDTWVWDDMTQLWHERESEGYFTYRLVDTQTFAGATIGGDIRDGRLYIVDPEAYTEDGDAILRSATGMTMQQSGLRIFNQQLTLDVETGVGLTAGQGSDPQIWLQQSDDGGRTWSSEKWADLGATGTYRTRVQFSRLGTSRQRVYRWGMSDPVRTTLMAMDLNATPGST